MMRARFPLLLLLGIVFLASVSVSLSIAPKKLCVQRCNRLQQCKLHCKPEEEEGGGKRPQPPHQPEDEDEPEQSPSYPHQQRPYPKKHQEKDQPRPYPQPPHKKDLEDEQDAEDEPRPYPYPQPPHKKDPEDEQDAEDEPRPYPYPPHQQQSEEDDDDDEYSQQSKKRPNNPYYFSSNNFPTYFKNQYGRIRLLQKFNKHSPQQLQNLREYRLIELLSKPNTLLLPHHADADYLILILSGRAILTLLYPNDSESFHLQRGDALKISSGTTYYVINPDDNENLKLLTFALPVNKPGSLETFFLSSTQVQQSYLQGFSKNILEASYDTQHEEIKSVLFGEEQQQQGEREQNREEGLIVELSKEQIRALSKHAKAKSSSRKTISSEDKPFNLKSNEPIYSNKFGKFYEITPEKNPQLRDLDMFLSFVDMNEGALLLPHYNSKAIVILVVNKGQGKIQLVGLKEQQKQRRREVQRYEAELSENDIYVVPAAYPVAINATSNLNLFAFGINAENNKRNFLAGEKENVISEIPSEVQELTFPGSAKEVEKVITKQKDSYFVDGQPEQNEEGSKGRKGPLSSILTAFY